MNPVAIILTADNFAKSFITKSGTCHVYVKVFTNDGVNTAAVPTVIVGVADADAPPLTGVNTIVGVEL